MIFFSKVGCDNASLYLIGLIISLHWEKSNNYVFHYVFDFKRINIMNGFFLFTYVESDAHIHKQRSHSLSSGLSRPSSKSCSM